MNAPMAARYSVTNLKLWRLRRHLGQREAARLFGFGLSAYSLIESGRMRPSESQIAALRKLFGNEADRMLLAFDEDHAGPKFPAGT